MLAGGADGDEIETIKDAIEANFAQPRPHRRLRHMVELFRGHKRPKVGDLYSRMRAWWGDGERAWLFDNEVDLTDLSAQTVGFDMTAILDDPVARTPALLYFFHRVEERLDGSPAIIVVDEGWKALDDDVFVRRIKDWEKTIRKRNGIVGFATQSAQDALESRIASAIIEQAATQIFMINPKARSEDYVDGFGLTQHEFELIRTLPDNSHCFLIKHGNESVVARLNLSGENDLLTILSGREATVRLFDELTERSSLNPVDWMAALMERSLTWPANAVQTGQRFVAQMVAHVDCQAQAIGAYGFGALSDPASSVAVALTGMLTLFVALFGLQADDGRAAKRARSCW